MALPVAQTSHKQNIGSQGHLLPFEVLLCLHPIAPANRRKESRQRPVHSSALLLKGKVSCVGVHFGKRQAPGEVIMEMR